MHPNDLAIEYFLSFKPWQYLHIDCLELHLGSSEEEDNAFSLNSLMLNLELLSNSYGDNLCIEFQGVKNLHLAIEGSNLQLMGELRISSFREHQWEDVRFKVDEKEGRHLSFLCRSFKVWLAGVQS